MFHIKDHSLAVRLIQKQRSYVITLKVSAPKLITSISHLIVLSGNLSKNCFQNNKQCRLCSDCSIFSPDSCSSDLNTFVSKYFCPSVTPIAVFSVQEKAAFVSFSLTGILAGQTIRKSVESCLKEMSEPIYSFGITEQYYELYIVLRWSLSKWFQSGPVFLINIYVICLLRFGDNGQNMSYLQHGLCHVMPCIRLENNKAFRFNVKTYFDAHMGLLFSDKYSINNYQLFQLRNKQLPVQENTSFGNLWRAQRVPCDLTALNNILVISRRCF